MLAVQSYTPQTNYTAFKGHLPEKVVQKVATTSKQLTSNNNVLAKNKKGVLATITALAAAFIVFFKTPKKAPEAEIETSKVTEPPKPTIKEPVKLEPTKENYEILEKKLLEIIDYEKSINYSNIEILQSIPEEKRRRIVAYLNDHLDDTKRFITFAAGEATGALLCVDSNYHNMFSSLENKDVDTSNFVWDKGGELIVDRKASEKIIKDHLEFFKIRLGLPPEANVEDVRKELLCCAYNSPLRDKNKSADLMQLLLGNDIYDACHAQIVKDIRKSGRLFYAGCASNLEEYKTTLKNSVLGNNSSYKNMPQGFKDDLIKKIDLIPEDAFRSRITEPIEFIREPKSELEKFRSLERLVQKLEKAQKYGTTIKFETAK